MPTFEVTSPDGKTFEITAPAGATKEQALQYAQAQFKAPPAQPTPAPAPQEQPGLGEKMFRGAIGGGPIGAMVAGAGHGLDKLNEFVSNTAYDAGGKVTDLASSMGASPNVAAGFGTAANAGIQALPMLLGARPAGKLATAGAEALGQAIAPNPQVAALARKAQALDIPIRPDMLTDNKFARMIGEAFEKIPLAGSRAEARQVAFNRALGSQIGADTNATKLTPDVFKSAMDASGTKIGDIAKRTPIALDSEAVSSLDSHVLNAEKYSTDTVAKIVKNYVEELKGKAQPTVNSAAGDLVDRIPGDAFRAVNSEIGAKLRATGDGDLRLALSNLQDDLQALLAKNIKNPKDLEELATARKQYAIGKTLEPLVAKSPAGDISPSALMGAVTNSSVKKLNMARGGGDMGDLARIGQLFLKEPASSGTTERAATYAAIGGAGYIEPTTAATVYGSANLYNRGGNAVTNQLLKLDALRR